MKSLVGPFPWGQSNGSPSNNQGRCRLQSDRFRVALKDPLDNACLNLCSRRTSATDLSPSFWLVLDSWATPSGGSLWWILQLCFFLDNWFSIRCKSSESLLNRLGSEFFNSSLFLANSLGTPSMSAGFHTNMSLFSLRKLARASSYALSSSMLIVAALDGSPVSRSIAFNEVSLGACKAPVFLRGISRSSCCIWLAKSTNSSLWSGNWALGVSWTTSVSRS